MLTRICSAFAVGSVWIGTRKNRKDCGTVQEKNKSIQVLSDAEKKEARQFQPEPKMRPWVLDVSYTVTQ